MTPDSLGYSFFFQPVRDEGVPIFIGGLFATERGQWKSIGKLSAFWSPQGGTPPEKEGHYPIKIRNSPPFTTFQMEIFKKYVAHLPACLSTFGR